jgi:hypothetical protein
MDNQSFYSRRFTRRGTKDNLNEFKNQLSGSFYVSGMQGTRASGVSNFMRRDTAYSRMSNTMGRRETIIERRDSVSSRDSRNSMFSKLLGRTSIYNKISTAHEENQLKKNSTSIRPETTKNGFANR